VTPKFVGLIPARSGSKGIPRKNLEKIGGSTLVELAAASAFGAGLTDVYLSSDSGEILESTSRTFPQTKTIKRSHFSATDNARASDVVFDFLDKAPEINGDTLIIYLQPTSPFRTASHVASAMSMAVATESTSVVSITDASPSPFKSIQITEGRIAPFQFSNPTENRQNLPPAFFPNGAIYIFSVDSFLRLGDVPVKGALPFFMDMKASFDIDSTYDLDLARLLWSNNA
jgi:CMP-N-acetylneuraminic acid synthetase